jgi:hypothetical protein
MKPTQSFFALALGVVLAGFGCGAVAQQHMHEHATTASPVAQQAKSADTRQTVAYPRKIKEHQLANMREHLLTVSRIQEYLSQHEFDKAGDLAEKRLGMSSLEMHGAHEIAPYMPKGMQEFGEVMHRAASKFAIAAMEASVDNDVGKALGAFAKVTQACVACHAAYRLK